MNIITPINLNIVKIAPERYIDIIPDNSKITIANNTHIIGGYFITVLFIIF